MRFSHCFQHFEWILLLGNFHLFRYIIQFACTIFGCGWAPKILTTQCQCHVRIVEWFQQMCTAAQLQWWWRCGNWSQHRWMRKTFRWFRLNEMMLENCSRMRMLFYELRYMQLYMDAAKSKWKKRENDNKSKKKRFFEKFRKRKAIWCC